MIWLVATPAFVVLAFFMVMAASSRARTAFCDWLDRRDEDEPGRPENAPDTWGGL